MKNKTIYFWDFDGVILESTQVRINAFIFALSSYKKKYVNKLIDYHQNNGGLSRYNKFEYFFSNILNKKRFKDDFNKSLKLFSDYINNSFNEFLLNKSLINTIKEINGVHYIVSGSDQNELRMLSEHFKISDYFEDIFGSPRTKIDILNSINNKSKFKKNECLFIGDSINDYQASKDFGIDFLSYNNNSLTHLTTYNINLPRF